MYRVALYTFVSVVLELGATQQVYYENDFNFKVEAGSRTCFFEHGRAGQILEAQYEVVDGQHGDWDISFEIIDPNGIKVLDDYKKTRNVVILDLEVEGEYVFCLDNSFSMMNSKLIYVYVLIEDKQEATTEETEVSVVDEQGGEQVEQEILQWEGFYEDGTPYYINVSLVADTMTRILKQVVKARHLLDVYGVNKSRDSHLAVEDIFIVDLWSGFQVIFMILVGVTQVFMIKKLFNQPRY